MELANIVVGGVATWKGEFQLDEAQCALLARGEDVVMDWLGSGRFAPSAEPSAPHPVFEYDGQTACIPLFRADTAKGWTTRGMVLVNVAQQIGPSAGTPRDLSSELQQLDTYRGWLRLRLQPQDLKPQRDKGGTTNESHVSGTFFVQGDAPGSVENDVTESITKAGLRAVKITEPELPGSFWLKSRGEPIRLQLEKTSVAAALDKMTIQVTEFFGQYRLCKADAVQEARDKVWRFEIEGIECRVVLETHHRAYLVIDLGSSTHLCGLRVKTNADEERLHILDSGPASGVPGHLEAEVLAQVYRTGADGAGDTVRGGGIRSYLAALDITARAKEENFNLSPLTGKADPTDRRNRVNQYPQMADLKWLVHLAHTEHATEQARADLRRELRGVYTRRALAAMTHPQANPDAFELPPLLSGNAEAERPVLGLILALPGYLRADLYAELQQDLMAVVVELNGLFPGRFTPDPHRHIGVLHLVPEPLAIAAYCLLPQKRLINPTAAPPMPRLQTH